MVYGKATHRNPRQKDPPMALLVMPAWHGPQHTRVLHGTLSRALQSPAQPNGPCFHGPAHEGH